MQASWSSKIATKNHTICKEAIYSQRIILSELPLISNNKPSNQNSRGWSHELSTNLCILFSTSDCFLSFFFSLQQQYFFLLFFSFKLWSANCNFRYQKLLLARESSKFLQHRLRIWLLESLTKILVPSWKKGLFHISLYIHFGGFCFWLLLNLMRQICCTQKFDLQTRIRGIPCTHMWWIFHIHVADLIYSKLYLTNMDWESMNAANFILFDFRWLCL